MASTQCATFFGHVWSNPGQIMTLYILLAASVTSLITFSLFGIDKRRARLGKRRIAERTLWTWAFAGGCIGGWIGMSVFRHKTQKRSFQIWMIAVTLLNPLWLALWLAW